MKQHGFTLIELMVVITIIMTLAAFGGLALRGLGGGAKLTTDAAKLMGWIQMARDQAITAQNPTALVLLTAANGHPDAAYRALTILEYQPPASNDSAGTWRQVTKWNLLSTGVIIDHDTNDSAGRPLGLLMPGTSPFTTSALPALNYLRDQYEPDADYACVIFLSNGAVYRDDDGLPLDPPYRIRLVEGFSDSNGTLRYTNQNAGAAANWAEILLNEQTGQLKLIRP